VQALEHALAIAVLVIRSPWVFIGYAISQRIVKQYRQLASGGCDRFGFTRS
jgi:hypothetical protein